mmetsp:Transcript_10769/g.16371  ORF Transcript_10769/g.16371 Transcript_10769/m.16371 type:complete len:319 (+) Transcript_10769:126-1082(+)
MSTIVNKGFVRSRQVYTLSRSMMSISVSDSVKTFSFEVLNLRDYIVSRKELLCITGAGISTASGIPDYRGVNGSYRRGHKPMTHSEFVSSDRARKRYWARSMAGYNFFSNAKPNIAHSSLAVLESRGLVNGIISQNVDSLHEQGGSSAVLHLHGRIDAVRCLSCSHVSTRASLQDDMIARNSPELVELLTCGGQGGYRVRADGDMDLGDIDLSQFFVPECSECGGVLKPDVVFFGDSVPKATAEGAMKQVESSDGLLVIGSSLEVYSAFRLVRAAINQGKPVAVVNTGVTRVEREGMPLHLKSEKDCCTLLNDVVLSL